MRNEEFGIKNYELRITHYELGVRNYELRIPNSAFLIPNYELRITHCNSQRRNCIEIGAGEIADD